MCQAIFCTYSRSIFLSSHLLQCLHKSALNIPSSDDIDGHSFEVFDFALRMWFFPFLAMPIAFAGKESELMENSHDFLAHALSHSYCVRDYMLDLRDWSRMTSIHHIGGSSCRLLWSSGACNPKAPPAPPPPNTSCDPSLLPQFQSPILAFNLFLFVKDKTKANNTYSTLFSPCFCSHSFGAPCSHCCSHPLFRVPTTIGVQ